MVVWIRKTKILIAWNQKDFEISLKSFKIYKEIRFGVQKYLFFWLQRAILLLVTKNIDFGVMELPKPQN